MEIRSNYLIFVKCQHKSLGSACVRAYFQFAVALLMIGGVCGCGTTKSFTATEQLLLSDAVDSTITKIDFRPLNNRRIFLETKYAEGAGKSPQGGAIDNKLVNSDYVISAVRQQLLAAGCMLVDKRDDAELVVEMRTGALGSDSHSVIYGIPATNISGATGLIAGAPAIPALPELAFAKRDQRSAAAKVALFAYDRQTLEPYWQSGIAQAGANSRDLFFLGVGPFQSGTIYAAPRFAGRRINSSMNIWRGTPTDHSTEPINGVDHRQEFVFNNGNSASEQPNAQQAQSPAPPPYGTRVSSEEMAPPVQR